ncbi:EXORDIUM like 2 [Perilla frutescens var. hirtella]|uniref:EXORDIUM like 2 n=1 Tax=Perilla frutescens var. hirtella TaxID=608512 RepID=A0AAD4JPM8_PERFH|nr:EXORDIUM like 2 [Perilla frutescens var. hirtella]
MNSLFLALLFLSFLDVSSAARNLLSLYHPPPNPLTYHNGALLQGDLHLTIFWYGKFTPPQKSIVLDFLASLDGKTAARGLKSPTVSQWWQTVQIYLQKAGKKRTRFILSNQISDDNCSVGKLLKKSQVSELAQRANSEPGGLTLVLTAADVAVEGFCMSSCGYHGEAKKNVFVWVGNSVTQCPGQCAWPFHQPIYGPQTKPLVAPNGDVGVDGMIVNIASLVAGAVTNPFGDGYHQGSAGAALEAASACAGVYGKGAYPGYAGKVLVDSATGGSYNARGVKGRNYLLPAILDPNTSQCSTLV